MGGETTYINAHYKAIRGYTNKSSISKQIADLHDNRQQIFFDTFLRVIPFGDFYKKDKTEEIIKARVKDATIGRRMLWLVELVPEKKSLLLAQKALNYRRIDKVMKAFFDIDVTPSPSANVMMLKNRTIYTSICETKIMWNI